MPRIFFSCHFSRVLTASLLPDFSCRLEKGWPFFFTDRAGSSFGNNEDYERWWRIFMSLRSDEFMTWFYCSHAKDVVPFRGKILLAGCPSRARIHSILRLPFGQFFFLPPEVRKIRGFARNFEGSLKVRKIRSIKRNEFEQRNRCRIIEFCAFDGVIVKVTVCQAVVKKEHELIGGEKKSGEQEVPRGNCN